MTVLPVASVAVDTGVGHLDRAFDYAVPDSLAAQLQPGCRVRVRFSGRLADGFVLERLEASSHTGGLAPLHALVSPEPVLSPEIARLARTVADRAGGALYDVLRLAVPPRHARVEAEPAAPASAPPDAPGESSWSPYVDGPGFLHAVAAGRPARAVWTALPGPGWPAELAAAAQAAAAARRGAVLVLPDLRDVDRAAVALRAAEVPHVVLRADLGPAERYRRWLAVRRGTVQVAVGMRATVFAPVMNLGLVVVWDDGDDLHAEPRAPYVHARDVAVQRAHLAGAALLLGGLSRSAEAQLLVESGWARPVAADRSDVRRAAPRVVGTAESDVAHDRHARAARLPSAAFEAARTSLGAGLPVLVQVPRRGYLPSLACARDRTPARCPSCRGPLAQSSGHALPACRWCGRPAGDWRCPECDGSRVRALVVGAARTAEELGRAFPGVPVRTSGGADVLAGVPEERSLVVATPGAEPPVLAGAQPAAGYGAVLLLDAWLALGRSDLRAGEEALRRWFAAAALARPATEGGRVVIVADAALPEVQALVRWDPAGAAARELAARTALGFPPAARMAAVEGSPPAVAELLAAAELPAGAVLLGPVELGADRERMLVRVDRQHGAALAVALKAANAVRSARKAEPVRIQLDPLDPG